MNIQPPAESNKKILTTPSEQAGQIEWLKYIINGVLGIIFLGFITLLFNYYQQNAVSFEDLKDQVLLNNTKIDFLTQQLQLNEKNNR